MRGNPTDGAQEQSLTQSLWPLRTSRVTHFPSWSSFQVFRSWSMPAETIIFWKELDLPSVGASMSDPGVTAGAQLTAKQPLMWASGIFVASHSSLPLWARMEIEPSELAHAKISPVSCRKSRRQAYCRTWGEPSSPATLGLRGL